MKLFSVLLGAVAARKIADGPAPDGTGAWGTFQDACDACKQEAKDSCTYYLTARCFAANVEGLKTSTDTFSTDKDEWRWAFDAENAGENYRQCFPNADGAAYIDNFGDKYDPNDSEGQWKKCMDGAV